MRRCRVLSLALLVLLAAACGEAKPPPPVVRDLPDTAAPPPPPPRTRRSVEIEQAAVGVFFRTPDGQIDFRPAKTIPLKPDLQFGWVIGLTTTKPTVRWREEFILPEAPQTWGPVEGNHQLSEDRKVSILEREVPAGSGVVYNVWTTSPGDPKGRHVMKVTIEDAEPVVLEFDFE
jgi:hypothetical protein